MRFSIPKVETKILVITMKALILILFPILLQAQTPYEYRWSRTVLKTETNKVFIQPKDRTSGKIIINERILKVTIKPEDQKEIVLYIDRYNSMNYPTTFILNGYTCYLRRNMLIVNYKNKSIHYKLRPSS